MYPHMLHYFDYLEDHSENNLVISDRKSSWCLGEWVTPEQETLNLFSGIKIPAPFVNTYFYIKSLKEVLEIAEVLDNLQDQKMLQHRLFIKKEALLRTYFNPDTGNFCDNVQGANAFAIDIGLGDDRTLKNMVANYEQIAHFDTGIFGTDIVIRVLFEKGYGNLAIALLTSRHPISFGHEMDLGATTLLEYWSGERSQCHPMFGAISVYLAEYILGIRFSGTLAENKIIINPWISNKIANVSGFVTTRFGKVSISLDQYKCIISYPKEIDIEIDVPYRDVEFANVLC